MDEVLTVEEVKKYVLEIENEAHDDEAAHSLEDRLYERVLKHISLGICQDPVLCCEEALKTQKINFARWCA